MSGGLPVYLTADLMTLDARKPVILVSRAVLDDLLAKTGKATGKNQSICVQPTD